MAPTGQILATEFIPEFGLGLDAGGTQTRWALASRQGHILAQGHVPRLSGLQLGTPGAGYLVYAGTGSIAAYIDAHGVFHRASGRGAVLGDEVAATGLPAKPWRWCGTALIVAQSASWPCKLRRRHMTMPQRRRC